MKIKYITSSLLTAFLISSSTFFTSCDDALEVGNKIDESAYEGIYQNNAFLRDGKSNQVSKIVELYNDTYTTPVKMGLSKTPSTATSASVQIDSEYLTAYNEEHNTDFELYPTNLVSFANDGVLTMNTETKSGEVEMTIKAGTDLEADKTYVLPLMISNASSDIKIKDDKAKHCIYLVKDMRGTSDCFKGEDKVKGYLFFEVNDTNPLNAFSFELENGKLLWDVVVLFAANINYDSEAGRPRIQCNPNVQFLLDNNETYLQPLRKRGIKVLLGLLGNHDMSGLAQLSKQGAKDFAREVAQYCKAFNLDGVNYDNEYSKNPDLNNPALAPESEEAAARLCYETKQAMPDKLVTVYDLSYMYGVESVDGVDVKEWIDIVVPDYGRRAYPKGNLTYKECAGAAMEFNRGSGTDLTEDEAHNLINKGWGWFMGFAADPKRYDGMWGRGTFDRLRGGCPVLYGSNLKNPTIFYKKNDPTPYRYPEDL